MTENNNAKTSESRSVFIFLILLIAASALFFLIGKSNGEKKEEELFRLNRSELEVLDASDQTIYVIGHSNPDADTVCSAVAYAELMQKLGYKAEARTNGAVDKETAFILKEAGREEPPVLEDAAGETIILVDHSEYVQSTAGMEDAKIIAIIDHHGVGSVTTGKAIVYDARPIGATATIVWMRYRNYGVEIEKSTAHLLLGAILSDTANLTSSAVTTADREAAKDLARIAGVSDIDAFYRGIHLERLSYDGMSSEEILFSDYKEYEAGGTTFGIALLSAIDEEAAAALAEKMKECLPSASGQKDVDLFYVAISIREGTDKIDYIVPGDEYSEEVFKEAFPNYDEYDGTSYIFRSGLGRKSKFVPGLSDHLNSYPKE